ncbi:MAG: hypothetical protein JNM86_08485 [Phycisphaerae bacterium]|nr:hypothetical protein [Phycisphaerae bacterium]
MLKVTRGDVLELIGRVTVVSVATLAYGIYHLWWAKPTPSVWHTWVPIVGAIASVILTAAYSEFLYVPKGTKSLRLALTAYAGIVPYLFSIYLMAVLGIGRIVGLFTAFSVGSLFAGLAWIVFGYWMLTGFWLITEMVRARDEGRLVAEPPASNKKTPPAS